MDKINKYLQKAKGCQIGVTLIELMIAIAIIGILASVAYPSYVDYVVRSNRTEAPRELLRIANLQEQYFVDSRTYTDDMTILNLDADPFITPLGHYSIDAAIANAGTSFVLTATAVGSQLTQDTSCTTIIINEAGQKTAESANCWE